MTGELKFKPIDTADIERWVGVPIGGGQPKDPYTANDIRRFVEAMANPNRLHWDDEYAARSLFGRLVAPQSYFGGGQGGTGPTPAIQGHLPDSHMLVGGDEHWFYGPRVYPGDRLRSEAMLFDFRVTQTRFAGPTVIGRGDTNFVNQRGEFVAKQRATSVRYLVENAKLARGFEGEEAEPEWTAEQLEDIDRAKLEWAASFVGPTKRLWGSVAIGDRMERRVIGPHSVQGFTSESRSEQGPAAWGSMEYGPPFATSYDDAGWLPEMSAEFERAASDPAFADPLFRGPSKGHVLPRYASLVGMPRAYGYGASILNWIVDYLANWAGDWGFVRHHKSTYRLPALSGDIAVVDGEVINKWHEPRFRRSVVQVSYTMLNQGGRLVAQGVAEIELPTDEASHGSAMDDPRAAARLRDLYGD